MDSLANLASTAASTLRRLLKICAFASVVLGASASLPWLLQDGARPVRPCAGAPPTLQGQLADSGRNFGRSGRADLDLVPFDRISFSRSPCLGDCPVYRMVLHKDGRAELSPGKSVTHRGEISAFEFARVAQLAELAQRAAQRREYLAQWTDDYAATIVVDGPRGQWQVLDYGEVAPVEVWALEQLLHGIYLTTAWSELPQ